MKISKKDWQNYIARLRKINDTAADKVANFMNTHDCSTPEGVKQLVDYAHAVATKYGEGAAELSCQMLDAVAEASSVYVPTAEPAATATYGEIAKTIYGTLASTNDPNAIGAAVGRSVKLASVDTLQQNALRDGAEWAWIPAGDTCPFCLMLASRGWVRASKKAIKNGHADHIHNNCDCTYCVRYDGETTVEGYDPDALYEQYVNAGETPRERLNSLRRQHYAANKDYINAQKRAAYARQIDNKVRLERDAPNVSNEIEKASSGEKITTEAIEKSKNAVLERLRTIDEASPHQRRMMLYEESTEFKYRAVGKHAPLSYNSQEDVIYYDDRIVNLLAIDEDYVITHDVSHRIDELMYRSWEDAGFKKSIETCYNAIKDKKTEIESWFIKGGKYQDNYAMADIFHALFKGDIEVIVDRRPGYYDDPIRRIAEIFADMSSMDVTSNPGIEDQIIKDIIISYKELVK